MFTRATTALKNARENARARRETTRVYERLLGEEHLLRDIGVSAGDIRHAMRRR